MAEDIVRRGCGGMGERWRDGAEAWRSGAEWQREIERKVERSCGMAEDIVRRAGGRYGSAEELCGRVEGVCGMAEDIVWRAGGGMRNCGGYCAEAWRSAAEWQRGNGNR